VSLVALGLILVAAIMHAGWNLVVKQATRKQVFMWLALVAGVLCFLVVPLISSPLPLSVWPYLAGSALAEAIYYVTLTWAYDLDDFSLIYPLARGAAPALLFVWAALFLGETPRPRGLIGITLLVIGLMIVGGGSLWGALQKVTLSRKSILVALMTACCVSIYTVIDGAAVRFVAAVPYTVVVLGLSALLSIPGMLVRYRPSAIWEEWRLHWWQIILVGLALMITYILVVYAYSITRVSYAGAIREVSVVFAALAGWFWVGERFGIARTIGSVLIFIGIIVISLDSIK
jgi:drug/metabolite transporter (DMT)-like permease